MGGNGHGKRPQSGKELALMKRRMRKGKVITCSCAEVSRCIFGVVFGVVHDRGNSRMEKTQWRAWPALSRSFHICLRISSLSLEGQKQKVILITF